MARSSDLSRPPDIDMQRPQDVALVGVHGRMEQLAAAMEVRLQAQETTMIELREELAAEKARSDGLASELSATSARLRHALDDAAGLRRSTEANVQAEATVWQEAAAERERLREEIANVRAAAAEADGRAQATVEALAHRVEALQELQAQARASAEREVHELRLALEDSRAELAVERAERRQADARVAEDLRGLDAHDARAREDAATRADEALKDLREELIARCEDVRRAVVEGIVGESQPSALDILRSTVARVDTLAAAVGTLCAHMESLRVKEVAALAEARVHEVESRIDARLAPYASDARGADMEARLVARLQMLEAAVQQEQASSLKALQAILASTSGR